MIRIITSLFLIFTIACSGNIEEGKLIMGAEQPELYLPQLNDKKVGLVVNHTSLVNQIHLVDFLLKQNVEVKKIFAPEHGFRGEAADGEVIKDGLDTETGVPVLSLYGKTKKPTPEFLSGIDVMIFDIQDVGCRFYTFISTLHYVMEACAENNVPLMVFDRPNPNGDYIGGPVLKPEFQSFVGMHEIPVVHGCTVGELAKMINEEGWLKADKKCDLTVVSVKNYTHSIIYELPLSPSPNLPNQLSVRLYPSLCFFEATSVSVGRGTDFPFQVLGGLNKNLGNFTFTPRSISGVSVHPPNKGKTCYGIDLRKLKEAPRFTLKYFIDFYKKYENEAEFLTREKWLSQLAGTDRLIKQIRAGESEKEIVESWQEDLERFKVKRKKYLIYPDFE